MALSSLSEKVAYIKQSRTENYRQSLRLEGINDAEFLKVATLSKKDVIAKYKALAS